MRKIYITLLVVIIWISLISFITVYFQSSINDTLSYRFMRRKSDFLEYYEKYVAHEITRPPITEFDYKNHNYDYDVLYGNDTSIPKYFHSHKHHFKEFLNYYKHIAENMENGTVPLRRMCFKPNNAGFGNKYFGMLSTIFLAMMTKRLFCICDWPVVHSYISFPMHIPIYSSSNLPHAAYYRYGPSCPGFPQFVNHTLSQIFPYDDIIIETNCMLIPYLNKNPSLLPYYEFMGLDQYTEDLEEKKLYIHHQLLESFVFPSIFLRNHYRKIWKSFPNATTYLGLQLRTGDHTDFPVLSRRSFLNHTLIESLIQEILNLTTYYPPPIRWFVVSDSTKLKRKIYKRYPQYVVYYNSTVTHPSIESIYHNSIGSIDALSEIYLLSKCKEIVITPKSTFGKLARAIRGKGSI